MNLSESMKNRWLRITALTAGWAFLGLVLSLELYFNAHAEMYWPDFTSLAIPQFGRAAMWACLTPFILRLREKMPLSRGRWVGGILFHFLFSFTVMATYYLGRTEAYRIFFNERSDGFWHSAFQGFYGHNVVDMACYWAVIAFGYGGELQRKFKNEEVRAAQLESRLIEAELKALREQLKPHFLFNTLNSVSAMVRDGKNEMAVTLLARLGSLLRMSLDTHHDNETSLRVEMDFLERYIDIQKARYSDRLTVNIAVSDEALAASVPWLILQPIVENSILHGVAPKAGPGTIDITGRIEGGDLHLGVRDDGPGIPSNRRVLEGTGLTNTRERLAKLYGNRASLKLVGHPKGGFSVDIIIPGRS
jgi:two-component system LytT family sensor kinase